MMTSITSKPDEMLIASIMSSIHGRIGKIMHINTPNTKATRPISDQRDAGWAAGVLMRVPALPSGGSPMTFP